MSGSFDTPETIGSKLADLERRMRIQETAARVPQITSGGIQAATNGSFFYPALTTSFAAVPGAQSVTFNATPQGSALVLMSINHTLEVSSGYPRVLVAPGITGVAVDLAYSVVIFRRGTVSIETETQTVMAYFEGLTPGSHTATLFGKKDEVSGTILTYAVNSHSIVALPL